MPSIVRSVRLEPDRDRYVNIEARMTLSAGTRLGSYEVIALLGAGGMGEVYRAGEIAEGRGQIERQMVEFRLQIEL